ncbi:hypothetical protein BVC80_1837g79 [Macleaya cordata]|uniref:Uncharacterized protein n=1 Tax=Macleaya cordata TaxID=56857 RepID=A0A200R3I9_MACCD|nr:hypothetical protein BVC80_1837g79 [Macleaya cordata]
MEAIKQDQPWRISVRAKAKNFDFKFSASKILPSWGFYGTRFSVLIKLQRFFLKVKSETGDSAQRRRRSSGTFKSKFLQLLEKFRLKRVRDEKVSTSVIKKKNPTSFWNNPQIGIEDEFGCCRKSCSDLSLGLLQE